MQKSLTNFHQLFYFINPLSGNPTKWSDIIKQFVGNLPTNCLSVFDHFAGLTLKGLRFTKIHTRELWNVYFFYILPLTFFLRLDKACDKLNFGKKIQEFKGQGFIPYYLKTSENQHPCQSVVSIKLLFNFTEIETRHGSWFSDVFRK